MTMQHNRVSAEADMRIQLSSIKAGIKIFAEMFNSATLVTKLLFYKNVMFTYNWFIVIFR